MGVRRSQTFAVLLKQGDDILVHYFTRLSEGERPDLQFKLAHHARYVQGLAHVLDEVAQILVQAGLAVRSFDYEEKQWTEQSLTRGVERVNGPRDGSWGVPDLEAFERDYLRQEPRKPPMREAGEPQEGAKL